MRTAKLGEYNRHAPECRTYPLLELMRAGHDLLRSLGRLAGVDAPHARSKERMWGWTFRVMSACARPFSVLHSSTGI